MNKRECEEFTRQLAGRLNDLVFNTIYRTLQANPDLRQTLNPAFPFPRLLRIAVLEDCLAVECQAPEIEDETLLKIEGSCQPSHSVFDFLGIDLSHCPCPSLSLADNLLDFSCFCGDSVTYLTDYLYDFTQNAPNLVVKGFFALNKCNSPRVISNTTYFWTDVQGTLKIRHIDFLELFPLDPSRNVFYHDDKSFSVLANAILTTRMPTYPVPLHRTLNEFIELISLPDTTEPQITNYLADNPEVLQLAFGAHNLNPQVLLEWQYDVGKPDLQPDFLIQRMDSYCDILDFELPHLKSTPIVGTATRTHPSYEVDTAIAQLGEYQLWCSQEVNQKWLRETKEIKIHDPVEYLVIGHSSEFSATERQCLRSIRNAVIFTYDEFIEMTRYQLYRVR